MKIKKRLMSLLLRIPRSHKCYNRYLFHCNDDLFTCFTLAMIFSPVSLSCFNLTMIFSPVFLYFWWFSHLFLWNNDFSHLLQISPALGHPRVLLLCPAAAAHLMIWKSENFDDGAAAHFEAGNQQWCWGRRKHMFLGLWHEVWVGGGLKCQTFQWKYTWC